MGGQTEPEFFMVRWTHFLVHQISILLCSSIARLEKYGEALDGLIDGFIVPSVSLHNFLYFPQCYINVWRFEKPRNESTYYFTYLHRCLTLNKMFVFCDRLSVISVRRLQNRRAEAIPDPIFFFAVDGMYGSLFISK